MNRDDLNYANNTISINNISNSPYIFPRTNNAKEYSTLNSIHLNSGIYDNSEKDENREMNRLKISVLLNEIKNVIENPDYNLNFQLIHMKCFNLNQMGLHLEFFEHLKNCLLYTLNNYASELTSLNNSLNDQSKIEKNEIDFTSNNDQKCSFSKKYLNLFLNKYEEYKIICMKVSETISILDIKSHYLNKFKLKGEDELNFDFLASKLSNKSDISRMNFIFKIIFSLFFDTVMFKENIQKDLLDNFFTAYGKVRKNFQHYALLNKEIKDYLINLKNLDKKNLRINISDDSSIGAFNEKNVSSNLKLNENNLDLEGESRYNCVGKYSISNFANFKKDDTIIKIKGILKKKKLLENKNYLTLQNNPIYNKNLIVLNENVFTRKKKKKKIPLKDSVKEILNIINDSLSLSVILNKQKLQAFVCKFDEEFLSEAKIFYSDYCKNYFENIKRLENSNKESNKINLNYMDKAKKDKFSHYDISILNYKSDNENSIDNFNIKDKLQNVIKKTNNCNLIDLDLCAYKNNQDTKIFINRKIPKENNLKSCGDIMINNYNTYSYENDYIDEKDVNCKFDFSNDSKTANSNKTKSKFKDYNNKNNKKKSKLQKIPIKIEGYILDITQLSDLEHELCINYEKKEEILNLILEQSLNDYENLISEGLRKFIDSSDLTIIKFLFALYSKNEAFKEKFNKILSINVISVLYDLEKNHIILNRHNRVEYVNYLFFVEEIFETKKKLFLILKESLNSYSRSELIIKTYLEKIVNKNFDFMENFVKLIHDEIKIAIKNKNPLCLKEFNEKFLAIYKLFNEKDLFEIEYRKYLSKRLLRNSSMVKETEYDFYEMLRKESGAIYTRKIEKILNEISLSYDLNVEYSHKFAGNINKNSISDGKLNNNSPVKNNLNDVSIYGKNSKNHNFNASSINKNINWNITNNNFIGSVNEEDDKNSYGLTAKINNNNNVNIHNKISTVNNFNHDEKEHIQSKFNINSHSNENSNNNLNNLTPLNTNNNFNLMNTLSTNSAKNPNNKAIVNSLILKSNNNCINNYIDDKHFKSILTDNPKGFKDHQVINEKFTNFIDINVKVVSSDCWLLENINIKNNKRLNLSEIKKNQDFNLPKILDKYIENYTEFYCNKFKNRQLKWIHEYSYAFIDMKSNNGKVYNIIASNYQMSFLCLFNKNKNQQISFKEILTKLNVNFMENKNYQQTLTSHFLPLFNNKLFLIINKEKDEINQMEENDIIYLNLSFNQEDTKIKLLNSIIEKKEITVAEEKKEDEVSHFVLEDRKHLLDAIIIKILKRDKIVEFEKLKSLLIEDVKKFFVPEIKFIKTRLENLMDRNFVKRSDDDPNCYEFI